MLKKQKSQHLTSFFRCPSYKFRCDYGACIDKNKLCDGVRDCLDDSDEYPDICPSTPSIKQKREIPNG